MSEGARAERTFAASRTASQAAPMLALAVWYGGLVGFGWLLGFREHSGLFMTIALVSGVAASAWMMRLGAGKPGSLVVTAEAVTIGKRSVARRGLEITVVAWKQAHLWTVIGTALELSGASGKLRIGGTGCLPPRRAIGSVSRVDASVSAEDFAEVSRLLGVEGDLAASTARDLVEIALVPSRTGARGVMRGLTPWFVTMGLAGSVGVLGSQLGLEQSPLGLQIMTGLSVVIVLGGVVFTFRKSAQAPRVRYRLLVGTGSVQLSDARDASATPSSATPERVTPVTYRYSTKYGTYEFAAVRLDWAHRPSMVVGVWDTTKAWSSPRERARRLDYLVGAEEWKILVDALGAGR